MSLFPLFLRRVKFYCVLTHELFFRFKPLSAKEIIHNVLHDQLTGKEFKAEEAQNWSREIADTIREKIKSMFMIHYILYNIEIINLWNVINKT